MTGALQYDTLNPTGYAQVLDEVQSGSVTRSYAWGLQLVSETQLVAATPPASPWQTSWYGFDGHGSVRYLTDATGAVTDTYTYDAFGNLINSTGSTANNYLFAGEQFDPDLGLYYNRARYLDVRVGRFWGMDTYEGYDSDPLSLHKYLYAAGNPVDNVDHSGNDVGDTIDSMATVQSIFVSLFLCTSNSCPANKKLFFNTLGAIIQSMAATAGTNPDFVAALSALESSWLGPHAQELHNPFGLTKAGGNDLNFGSYQEAADYWSYSAGRTHQGYAVVFAGITNIDEFIAAAKANGYNAKDPLWGSKVKNVYTYSILPFKKACGFNKISTLLSGI